MLKNLARQKNQKKCSLALYIKNDLDIISHRAASSSIERKISIFKSFGTANSTRAEFSGPLSAFRMECEISIIKEKHYGKLLLRILWV